MAAALNDPPAAPWNPFRCTGTPMDPAALLVAKFSLLLLLVDGFPGQISRPYAPFLHSLDALRDFGGYAWILRALFLVAGAFLIINARVRVAALVAGGVVLLTQFQSIPAYSSHVLLCGCMLLLTAAQAPGERPWFIRAQMILLLAAIALDRPFTRDWSGDVVLEGWSIEGGSQPFMHLLRKMLPAGALTALMGWITTAAAALIAIGICLPRTRRLALWMATAFHLGVYLLIGTKELGIFTLTLGVGYIAFLDWPRSPIQALWPRACGWPMWLRIALDHYDVDRQIEWPFPENPDGDLEVWVDDVLRPDRHGITALLRTFAPFHFVVLGLAALIQLILPEPWSMIAHLLVAAAVLSFFAHPTFARLRPRRT